MPTCRRKRVMLQELTPTLLSQVQKDPGMPVFYMEQTGEIFTDYESYAARLSFYRLKQFQCEVTGKSGLDYFQALESEQQEARTLHARFPQSLKAPVLRAVQWQVIGRLDHLVEAVYERFKDRYFEGERVNVDVQGDRYWARVVKVFPPRALRTRDSSATSDSTPPPARTTAGGQQKQPLPSSTTFLAVDDEQTVEPHRVTGNLKMPVEQVNAADDPRAYLYRVQLDEGGREPAAGVVAATVVVAPGGEHDANGKTKPAAAGATKWGGSLMEVSCEAMSRDRLSFSKSILRRFIRDCVDRDAAVASPWTVKKPIADRYGVENVMPEETRKGVQEVKNKEIEKRKKVWEDKDGPPSKKQKKADERAAKTRPSEDDERAAAGGAGGSTSTAAVKEEQQEKAEVPPALPPKKKYVKYPTEDLDVVLSQREKAKRIAATGQAYSVRPTPCTALPFSSAAFESLLMTWSFLTTYGNPLKLSKFTLDDFENAIRHSDAEQPVKLIAEIHSSLVYALRALSTHRHLAVLSLLEEEDDDMHAEEFVRTEELTDALAEVGNNWERQPLRVDQCRSGWEEALVGCLKDQATVFAFPTLRRVLTKLLFAPEEPTPESDGEGGGGGGRPASLCRSTPGERYYLLPADDKLAILAFLCDAVVSHKDIHVYMESCESNLTRLRKDKIEIRKERKKVQETVTSLEKKESKKGGSEPKESKDSKEPKESKESKESKEPKESKEVKESTKEPQESEPDQADVESELSDYSPTVYDDSMTPPVGENEVQQQESEQPTAAAATTSDPLRRNAPRAKYGHHRMGEHEKRQRILAQVKVSTKTATAASSAKDVRGSFRRLELEASKLDRMMETIERDFRRYSGVVRMKPLGKDRFHNRYWWFDGVGSWSLVSSGAGGGGGGGGGSTSSSSYAVYGTGRLFIQGPAAADYEIMERKQKEDPSFDLAERRREQEGEEGMLTVGSWGYYSDPEQVSELMNWLNIKGNRELKLKENLSKWIDLIQGGMKKRLNDLAITTKLPEARRSTRAKNLPDSARHQESYMLWRNEKAPNLIL